MTRHPTFVTATSGVLTRLPAKALKMTECVFTRCPTGGQKKIACIHGLRSEGVLLMKSEKIEIKDAVQEKKFKNCNNFSPSQHGTACCALMHSATYITFTQSGSHFSLLYVFNVCCRVLTKSESLQVHLCHPSVLPCGGVS